MKKIMDSKFRPVNPSPAALITSVDKDGKPNIIALAEVFNISISQPVIAGIGIRPATYSHSLIQESGEFVINLTTSELAEKVDACGSISGRAGHDKFKLFGLTQVAASFVKPPLIKECPVNLECKVVGINRIGDHDLILGEVVAVHADEDKLDANGGLDLEKLDLLVYMSGSYWSLGKKIGNHGFTNKKR
ncbi:MAG TPA: flavin reductase family protein [Ruminiclostridium sp.]